jgi:hypothetical protein
MTNRTKPRGSVQEGQRVLKRALSEVVETRRALYSTHCWVLAASVLVKNSDSAVPLTPENNSLHGDMPHCLEG